MRDACETHHVYVWAYSLMDNHVHLVQVPEEKNSLSLTIQEAHGEYARYLNSKYNLAGHAWHGRFKSVPMEEWHCWNTIRYVERIPVRAGMVEDAEDYLWSSAATHCGLRDDTLLSGNCPLVGEIKNWSEWLRVEDDRMYNFIRSQTRLGQPLGSDEFIRSLELKTGRQFFPRKRGPKSKSDPVSRNADQGKPDFDGPSTLFR